MGQSWDIFSVNNGEIIPSMGKLSEFLTDHTADCLVDLLAVPVKPGLAQLFTRIEPSITKESI
jgi:hypothetical protein